MRAPAQAVAFAGALALAACQTPQQTGTSAGGAVGAGADALVTTATTAVTLAGVAVSGVARGSVTDALVGPPAPRHCARWGHDRDRNPVCKVFS